MKFHALDGQSFRWRATAPDEYTGVIGQRVVSTTLQESIWNVRIRVDVHAADGSELPVGPLGRMSTPASLASAW